MLLVGDLIRLRDANVFREIQGRVKGTRGGVVQIELPLEFSSKPPLEIVHVRFVWNRIRFRRAYLALFNSANAMRSLFPKPKPKPSRNPSPFNLGDIRGKLDLSSEQKTAICAVLNSTDSESGPVLLLGAAGTGTCNLFMLLFLFIRSSCSFRFFFKNCNWKSR